MDHEKELLDDETFDFADGFLIDDDKENKNEMAEEEEEVFFGPVSFKEKCRERWANDLQAGAGFEDMASKLGVEDWCEIFVNANIVASTLTASAKKRIAEQHRLTAEEVESEALISAPPASPNDSFRRSTFTLDEAKLLLTPEAAKASGERVSAVSDTSSYYTAQSSFSSPTSDRLSLESDSAASLIDAAKTPVNRLSFERPVTPPTVVKDKRRSLLPTPTHTAEARPVRRRSLSCEERCAAPALAAAAAAGGTPAPALRPALSDASLAGAGRRAGASRLKPPAPLAKECRLPRPLTTARAPPPPPPPSSRHGNFGSRLMAPSIRPSKIPPLPLTSRAISKAPN